MSATLAASVTTPLGFSASGTTTTQFLTTNSSNVFLAGYPPSFIFNGSVGLGLTPTTQQLDLSTDNARKLTTSTWTTGSDRRIKLNICTANLVRCAEIVDTLDLKYFEWKIGTDDKHSLGWIAQDVQTFFPKSVVPDEDGILMLNSDQLVKVLYGALKQTQKDFFQNQ